MVRKPTKFTYPVNLVPLQVKNQEREILKSEINNIPYLLYEVECLKDGRKIVINKPGGKRSYGRLSKHDFMVFVLEPETSELWLISHEEIYDDIKLKLKDNEQIGLGTINALEEVCIGKEPDDVIKRYIFPDSIGLPLELILKAYKWIWAQEDVNYPNGKGRWLSMDALRNLTE